MLITTVTQVKERRRLEPLPKPVEGTWTGEYYHAPMLHPQEAPPAHASKSSPLRSTIGRGSTNTLANRATSSRAERNGCIA